jgi:serralysin
MVGGAGNDTFFGGDGDDRMEGGAGDDILNGNTGRDTAIYTSATAGVTVNLGITTAQNTIGAGNDTLNSIERLIGSNFDDTLTGNTSNNVIYGQDGNDVIFGDAGSDVIYGGAGNDILTGGLGQDSFMFDTALNALTNVDQIQDFRVHYDKIRLDSSIFTQAGALGTLDANAFHAGLTAADASDRIIYDSTTGNIYYDADGDGAGAQVLFAHVTAGTALTNADIIII